MNCYNCGCSLDEGDSYITMPNDFGMHTRIGERWCENCARQFRERLDFETEGLKDD